MGRFLQKYIQGEKVYFFIVIFIIFLIILSGIISPIIINSTEAGWENSVSAEIRDIETSSADLFHEKEAVLLDVSSELKSKLRVVLSPGNTSYGSLIKLVNSGKYKDFSVQIVAPNGKLIAWNRNIAVPQEDIFPLNFPAGQPYFYNTGLLTYLSLTDTLYSENDLFYYLVSMPFEKLYTLRNRFYEQISFSNELTEKFLTEFKIYYSPYAGQIKDGRMYSFDLLNNSANKIGVISFVKPSLNTAVLSISEIVNIIQSMLILIAFIFAGLGFKREFNGIKSTALRLLIFIIYCSAFRSLIFLLGFPSNIIEGPLADPANFSSAFAGGIVKSPVEFFITNVFVLIISIAVYKFIIHHIKTSKIPPPKLFFLILVPLILLFLLILRGLIAAVKSVIFDSSLRYFKDPTILPDITSMTMNLNVLILGLAVLLLLSGVVLLLLNRIPLILNLTKTNGFILLFFIFQLSGVLFIIFQKDPLINVYLSFIFISLVFLYCWYIFFYRVSSVYNYLYAALISSFITIILLNYFNLQLEKGSLKTTAMELNRPDENLIRFTIHETLNNGIKNTEVTDAFSKSGSNFDALAFRIWSQSTLQRESIRSSVLLLDKQFEVKGRFDAGFNYPFDASVFMSDIPSSGPVIKDIPAESGSGYLTGLLPLKKKDLVIGFLAVAVENSSFSIAPAGLPSFLESRGSFYNTVLDISEIKIFELVDGRLSFVSGEIYPSRDQIRPVMNELQNQGSEAWITISINEERYLIYALKSVSDGHEIVTAVALREKQLTWNLFNFFKIFIIHSFYIIIFFLLIFFYNIRYFKYTFRTQLLLAFLLISIIPVILLAVYNREVVKTRSALAVSNELNERAEYLINHFMYQKEKHTNREFDEIFSNAAQELGIQFSIYDETNLLFSSSPQYYKTGLFSPKINPRVYFSLNYLSYREYITEEEFDNYKYNSFYKRFTLDNKGMIIGVNDAFNKVRTSLSTIDVDIFLFGVYSFALIMIIVISTLMANRISAPIRRLTKATNSIAKGDLNIELVNKEKGEIKELLDGFNAMTKELHQNQVDLAELERENAWKEMAKQVAHEIKNPLTPMKLALQQLIISYKDNNKNFSTIFDKVTATILNQIDNLNLIASEFSRFAKMPSLKLEKIELIESISDTVNLFLDDNILISVDTNLDEAPVEADITQLRRMFINLIRNSIQAGASEIVIKIADHDDCYSIDFSDNGSGVPENVIHRIFDPNFTTKEKGMGIGLSLAKRFIEGIKGRIELKSTSAAGTLFSILIPKLKEIK